MISYYFICKYTNQMHWISFGLSTYNKFYWKIHFDHKHMGASGSKENSISSLLLICFNIFMSIQHVKVEEKKKIWYKIKVEIMNSWRWASSNHLQNSINQVIKKYTIIRIIGKSYYVHWS